MKTTEDFADVILKLLNAGVPYGKMHPQKARLIAKLQERERKTREEVIEKLSHIPDAQALLSVIEKDYE